MDLDIRKQFTPYVKFIDFKNNLNTENALYGPAMMQRLQEQKLEIADQNTMVSSRLTTASSEMSS